MKSIGELEIAFDPLTASKGSSGQATIKGNAGKLRISYVFRKAGSTGRWDAIVRTRDDRDPLRRVPEHIPIKTLRSPVIWRPLNRREPGIREWPIRVHLRTGQPDQR
jgi:hypothetical protein